MIAAADHFIDRQRRRQYRDNIRPQSGVAVLRDVSFIFYVECNFNSL